MDVLYWHKTVTITGSPAIFDCLLSAPKQTGASSWPAAGVWMGLSYSCINAAGNIVTSMLMSPCAGVGRAACKEAAAG